MSGQRTDRHSGPLPSTSQPGPAWRGHVALCVAAMACLALPLPLLANATAATQSATTAPATATVAPPEVQGDLPAATLRGAMVLRWLGLQVYDARLWATSAVQGDGSGQPLALELQYARSLSGARIASRSVDEMRRIGPVSDEQAARWLAAMQRLFPDVKAGDRLTGVQQPGQGARFYFNGRLRGELADADFARLFFGIWLSPRTSEPGLRAQLVGERP